MKELATSTKVTVQQLCPKFDCEKMGGVVRTSDGQSHLPHCSNCPHTISVSREDMRDKVNAEEYRLHPDEETAIP